MYSPELNENFEIAQIFLLTNLFFSGFSNFRWGIFHEGTAVSFKIRFLQPWNDIQYILLIKHAYIGSVINYCVRGEKSSLLKCFEHTIILSTTTWLPIFNVKSKANLQSIISLLPYLFTYETHVWILFGKWWTTEQTAIPVVQFRHLKSKYYLMILIVQFVIFKSTLF